MTDEKDVYRLPARANGKTPFGALGGALAELGIKGTSPEGMAMLAGAVGMVAILRAIEEDPYVTDEQLRAAAKEGIASAHDPRKPRN